jgi:tryptophan-rich sensory protein
MKSPPTLVAWLKDLKRGYKFAILLTAAWSPFLFPEHPVLTGLLMGLCTTIFLLATGSTRPTNTAASAEAQSTALEGSHVEP